MSLSLGVIAMFIALTAGQASSASALKTDLTTLHDQWFTAFDKGDGATMDKLEVENLVIVFQDGQVWKKARSRVGNMKPTGYAGRKLSDVDVRQFGDTAILTGRLATTEQAGAAPVIDGTTIVFVRQQGGWRIASAQWSSVPAKK